MKIGEVARRTGLTVEAIRFYERQGLIEEPPRSRSRYRDYPEEVVSRLDFIQRSKELGFSLREVGELLALRDRPDARSSDVKERAGAKVREIERKIRALRGMKTSLSRLARACDGEGPTRACAILTAIETGNEP
jgi:MerR family mercuric resistance operon transcriptional regulator